MIDIETVSYKLATWSCLEEMHGLFDASLPRCLLEHEIVEIETTYKISLPEGYRNFLEEVGNGGPGPYGSVWSIEQSLAFIKRYLETNPEFLWSPFPLTGKFNVPKSYAEFHSQCEIDEYLNECIELLPHYLQGTLPICEYGCGVFFLLVISGSEQGSVWEVDFNEISFYPLSQYHDREVRVDFLTWYENWLNEQLRMANGIPPQRRYGTTKYGFVDD